MPNRVRAHYRNARAQSRAVFAAANLPVNSVLPAISGTTTVGQTLTCSTGTWTQSPSFAYQWRRDGVSIAGATASTRVLVAGDAGALMSCSVIATKNGSQAVATSANTAAIAP
jgi:hypothetical protein